MKKPYISDEKANLVTMRDPMIMVLGDAYYLTGTQPPYWEGEVNEGVRLWSSKDLVSFTDHGLILKRSDMPKHLWCRDRFWAPELFDGGDGWIYLTFNCRNESEDYKHIHSAGLARAKEVTGPYEIITRDGSLTEDRGRSNDATLFRDDDGTVWLGCNIKGETRTQTLQPIDLSTGALGEQILVCGTGAEGEWDSIGVEGACIVKRHGIYFHWYSSWTNGYNAGVLTADNLRGPWRKSPDNPILVSNDIWHLAGHNHSFVGLDGKDYFIFHAFLREPDGEDLPRIFIRRVDYLPDGGVRIHEDLGFGE